MSTNPRRYVVQTAVWANGERFPMIVDRETRLPLLDPTVYAMGQLRQNSVAASTIGLEMYGVRVVLQYLEYLAIDLVHRIHKEGKFLEMHELETIARLCNYPAGQFEAELEMLGPLAQPKALNIGNIERFRSKAKGKKSVPTVSKHIANIRLAYLTKYLKWIADRELLRVDGSSKHYPAVRDSIKIGLEKLSGLRHITPDKNSLGSPIRGLPEAVRDRIIQVIELDSHENPWRSHFNRVRNRLYVYWLLELALRKGETLGVMLEDVNFPALQVDILRRPDNPDDPRGGAAPLAKTRDRRLFVNERLLEYTEEYLILRRELPKADHEYLFVSSWTGEPISQGAARDIFHTLRRKVPDLPDNLTARVLRHTWNTQYTLFAHKKGISEATRLQTMRNQNGWSDRSKMPDRYSHAATDEISQEESLIYQQEMQNNSKKNRPKQS